MMPALFPEMQLLDGPEGTSAKPTLGEFKNPGMREAVGALPV